MRWRRLVARLRHWVVEERGYRWLVLACTCALVELGYVFITSAGRFSSWPSYANRVDQLAEAFRTGQLHLLRKPPPALVNAPNPFDPALVDLWFWDASLYKGRYYFYFGPFPALVLAGIKSTFHIERAFGDEIITLALATFELITGAVLLERLARRLFNGIPVVLVALAVVAFGLANPAPFILARPEAYEAAIVGGQAFLLMGIAFAFEAVWNAEGSRRSSWFTAAASLAWALALGCRVSLAPAVLFLALATTVATSWRREGRHKRVARNLVIMAIPLLLGVSGLLAYNKARFDRFFEFGTGFQLTWFQFKLSSSYLAANIYSYGFRPVETSCEFPFLLTKIGDSQTRAFPAWILRAPGYWAWEQVAGIFVTAPWVWLVVPAVALLGLRAWRSAWARAPLATDSIAATWAGLSLCMAASLGMLVPLFAPTATMRYLGDGAGSLLVLAGLGAFATYAALHRVSARRSAVVAFALISVVSASAGLALGTQGYYEHFSLNNPKLEQRLERSLSVCPTPKK